MPFSTPDHLEADVFSPLGAEPLVEIDLALTGAGRGAANYTAISQAIVAGIDRAATLPVVDIESFDLLLTTAANAPAPWVSVAAQRLEARVDAIRRTVATAPIAAAALCQVLRGGERLPLRDALLLESFAYSTLLGGGEFRRWLAMRPPAGGIASRTPYLEMSRDADCVTVRLTRPESRNAMCAGMRDALFEALAAVLDDPSGPTLRLEGEGTCFSTGGALNEFGTSGDRAHAHAVRMLRSCAALLAELGDRAEVILHGACVGSGIEIAAGAARRLAREGTYFQLPEVRMGLIPGAGGTATISRAIGRHRTACLALSARRLDAATAHAWGLVHALLPAR